jgi:hypothetical protein
MKIVDSFLFSEIFEKELLLLKFIVEDNCVSEWILLENAFSFQGDFKGLQAESLINSDHRFNPFRHKITIISESRETAKLKKDEVLDDQAFKVEHWQRNLAYQYFIDKYSDEDWIIISDVDESLDFSDTSRRNELLERMKNSNKGVLHVSTKRFWYDFDNEYQPVYGIPMCTKDYLKTTGKKLHNVRIDFHADLKMSWNQIIGFEYSSCFNMDEIFRKLNTNSHMAFSMDELKQSLRCNHRPISKARGITIQKNNRFFFSKIVLTESNSPKYVRDNFELLRTNNIDPLYKINRKKDYYFLYTSTYKLQQRFNLVRKIAYNFIRQVFRILKVEKFIYE